MTTTDNNKSKQQAVTRAVNNPVVPGLIALAILAILAVILAPMFTQMSQHQIDKDAWIEQLHTDCLAVGGDLDTSSNWISDYQCVLDDGTFVDPQKRKKAIDNGRIKTPYPKKTH